MSKGKKKHPKTGVTPHPTKKPQIDPSNLPDSILKKKPLWRFQMIDFEGAWGWNNISDKSVLFDIYSRLKSFETMTWAEIEGSENHLIETYKICKDARDRLKEIGYEGFENLFSFHVTGKKRIWGIRDTEALNILWWDPEHTVYPVPKKHT